MTGAVFVTGASGFIGRALVERYAADGAEVRGVDIAADPSRGIVAGRTEEPAAWADALQGCDRVVHTAAVVSFAGDESEFWRVNVLGTRRVLEAAAAAGVARFVHLSSVTAFGFEFPDGVNETWPVRCNGSPYVDTKVASEQVVLQAHAAGEIECTVIRPGDVHGPGSRPWTIIPVEMLRSGRMVLPMRGEGIHSPVFVGNLVDGIRLAAASPSAAGEVITVSDGVGITYADFFGLYARMLGRSVRTLPTPLVRAVAGVAEGAAHLTRRSTEINRFSVDYFCRTGTYSIGKARRLLGYEPRVGLDEGMRITEAWLRETGRI
jgi:nucleoside-diphosphate-sugar epimerase